MANGTEGRNRHFILEGVTETEPYRSQGGGRMRMPPERNRAQHGAALQRQIGELRAEAESAREAQQAAGMEEGLGLQVEFESFPEIEIAFESLARERLGIELLNVRHEEDRIHATVFVPDGKLAHFEGLVSDYLAEKRDSAGRARDNRRLIDAIRQIRAASLRALWTDDADAFPTSDEGSLWWEVWLPVRGERQAVESAVRERAEAQGMRVAPGALTFPERTVLLTYASVEQMQRSMLTLNSISELRRAKETAEFFHSLPPEEQPEWLDDLLARTRYPAGNGAVPHVCLLDTGINRGHPLLAPALAAGDLHTVEPGWGTDDTDGIHDPAQAWNVLTVGACTDLVRITGPDASGYSPIAPQGGLSPFSTTSLTWQQHWPMKPDVVLEGGNAAEDQLSAAWMPSLSLLTSHHRPLERLLTTTNATSAATALASRLAAQVMAAYPDLWPETIRALIVHSAEWTDAMKRMFLPAGRPSKKGYQQLVRRCGFGVPDLARALWSVANSLTMVVQESVHPFKRGSSGQPKLRDMHLHNLPWPRDVLESLGETEVEMRVTLSYFIEPNPSHRGLRSRYRYESHGLRFDVKRPLETTDAFRRRINLAARDEEEGTHRGDTDPSWLIGRQQRHRGSLHGDIWRGSAAELASRGSVAVYPALGWWKTRPALERYDREARYALVIGIRAPETNADLYTEVANRIDVSIETEI